MASKSRSKTIALREQKAEFLLKRFTPAELQSFVTLDVPKKLGRSYDAQKVYRTLAVPATGIPASTIKRFQTGQYKLGSTSRDKLAKFYDRYMYWEFRSKGARHDEGKQLARLSPIESAPYANKYLQFAYIIQANHASKGRDVPIESILWGMAHSHHKFNEWEKIAKTSGLKKPPPAPTSGKKRPRKKKTSKYRLVGKQKAVKRAAIMKKIIKLKEKLLRMK